MEGHQYSKVAHYYHEMIKQAYIDLYGCQIGSVDKYPDKKKEIQKKESWLERRRNKRASRESQKYSAMLDRDRWNHNI